MCDMTLVVVRKFTQEEVRQADDGVQGEAYDLFMAYPKTAGINKRAKFIYVRHPDGREKTDENGNRIKDDQIATVAGEFRQWVQSTV